MIVGTWWEELSAPWKRTLTDNIIKVWKDYAIKDSIIVIEKEVKVIKPETGSSCWIKLCPDIVHAFTKFTIDSVKKNHEKYGECGKRWEWISRYDLGEIQELRNTTLETLAEDNLMKMSASEQMPADEEDTLEVSENKLSLHNLAEGFQLLKIVFYFFFF